MWFTCRQPAENSNNNNMRSNKGTPIKRKVKHSQSARDCDCYEHSPDKNAERNYILSFLKKSRPQQEDKDTPVKKKKKNNKDVKKEMNSFNEKQKKNKSDSLKKTKNDSQKKTKSESQKKNPLKRATSITLKRNRIIPLNDGSGGCVLVSQTTTIKETPCEEQKKVSSKEEHSKRRFNRLFKRVTNVRRKAQEYLMKKKCETLSKEKANEPAPKPFVEFEKIPSHDDFVEENFEEEDEPEEDVDGPESDNGRESVCSSGYFTPIGESPGVLRRSKRLSLALSQSPDNMSMEVFEEADGESVDSDYPSVTVESIRQALDAAVAVDREEIRRKLRAGDQLYPNCDNSIWMRSCQQEVVDPIYGATTGK